MSDRIFGGVALVVTLLYGWLAFTVIKAPFQYDILGPETWPRLLSIVASLCCLLLLWKPDTGSLDVKGRTWFRILVVLVMLSAYAVLYEDLGFVISTTIFCAAFASLLGASSLQAILFGVATGLPGYLLCAKLLELNLPAGPLVGIL